MKNKLWFKTTASAVALIGIWLLYEACTGVYGFTPFEYDFSSGVLNSYNGSTQFDLPDDLPELNKAPDSYSEPYWKVFYSVGDGQWFMGNETEFKSQVFYTFGQTKPGKTFAEVTGVYDDNNNPVGRIIGTIPPPPLVPSQLRLDQVLDAGTWIKIDYTRKPKSGDKVTYIITYQNRSTGDKQGTIRFVYDPAIFYEIKLDSIDTFKKETVILNSHGEVQIQFDSLGPNEQRSIFLHASVKLLATELIGTHPITPPNATWYNHFGVGKLPVEMRGEPQFTYTLTDQTVVQSHDPNLKTTQSINLCKNAQDVTFRIEFQNEGTGPTKTVEVRDIIDPHLIDAPIEIVGHSSNITSSDPITYLGSTPRTAVFKFPTLKLNGTHQDGYGKRFSEESTKAWFEIKLNIKDWEPCGAIVNRAHIFFDCNPPVTTTTAIATFNCDSCTACISVVDTTIGITMPITKAGKKISQDTAVKSVDAALTGFTKVWYPGNQINNLDQNFTLVASKACERRIYHFKSVESGCEGRLSIDASGVAMNCDGADSGKVNVTLTNFAGRADPINNVKWNDDNCSTGANGVFTVNKGDRFIYIGVTDVSSGCFVDTLYELQPAQLKASGKMDNCTAMVDVQGGTPPYAFEWKTTNGATINTLANTSATLNLIIKGRLLFYEKLECYITDHKNCKTYVSFPQPTCEEPGVFNTWNLIAIAAGIILLLILFLRRIKWPK